MREGPPQGRTEPGASQMPHRQVPWDRGQVRGTGPGTHPLSRGLAAGTVSVTAAFLSSSSFSYPENISRGRGE